MAENDERETLQEAEITSEENPIEEDELELSLGLRPIHPRSRNIVSPQNYPEFSNSNPIPTNSMSFSKRDVQAIRRQEAKKRRDLKRKANGNNRVWLGGEDRDGNSGDSPTAEDAGHSRKEAKLNASYWAPPSWWSWNPAAAGGGGFRPYQGQNGKFTNFDGENRQSISSGSSSGISDNYQSTSGPGGTNSDVGSHSSPPYSQPSPPANSSQVQSQVKLQPKGSTAKHFQPEICSFGSNHIDPIMSSRPPPKSPEVAAASSNVTHKNQTSFEGGPLSSRRRLPITQTSTPKEVKVEIGKPPKPTSTTNRQKLLLSQMPCVSVTGNGPNGKTITGFLYQYTKAAEVSIVCVCHGASFTPAGFVEHAGGVDVEHPLKHIRVVPFALG